MVPWKQIQVVELTRCWFAGQSGHFSPEIVRKKIRIKWNIRLNVPHKFRYLSTHDLKEQVIL